MSTDLSWIGEKARREPKLVFTSLYHHITDVDNLRDCYGMLDGHKAVGIDGVSKEEYGKNLEENLRELSEHLKRMGYRPQPKRRTYIPKPGSEKGRPLGISCLEDKIVELAVKRVLEPIYEEMFKPGSYGYRPGRNQHQCLEDLGRLIQQKPINCIVEADVRSFFDKVNHDWQLKFLEHRIGDPRVLRLIQRMLKAGIMEEGLVESSEEGTPQGSILSPLLANIYLHYTLDWWFESRIKRQSRGEAHLIRFADDFLACFQYREDAEDFHRRLPERLEGFGLAVAEEKTQCIEFGRHARAEARKRGEKPAEFDFLGFTHYCGKTRHGHFKLKRRTSRKKLQKGLREFTDWARRNRNVLRTGAMIRRAKARVQGHLNYYAITDNYDRCQEYNYHATRILLKWLNRKSQRKTYTWEAYTQALQAAGWPDVRIRKDLCPFRTVEAL